MFSFIHSKKAQGMSLNMVIAAVIALVVLIVIILIFTGKTKMFSKTSSGCPAAGGTCMPTQCEDGFITHSSAACLNEGEVCCARFDAEPVKDKTTE